MIFNSKKYKKLKFDFQELKAAYDHSSELYQKVLNENHQLHKTIKGLKEIVNKNNKKSSK